MAPWHTTSVWKRTVQKVQPGYPSHRLLLSCMSMFMSPTYYRRQPALRRRGWLLLLLYVVGPVSMVEVLHKTKTNLERPDNPDAKSSMRKTSPWLSTGRKRKSWAMAVFFQRLQPTSAKTCRKSSRIPPLGLPSPVHGLCVWRELQTFVNLHVGPWCLGSGLLFPHLLWWDIWYMARAIQPALFYHGPDEPQQESCALCLYPANWQGSQT